MNIRGGGVYASTGEEETGYCCLSTLEVNNN